MLDLLPNWACFAISLFLLPAVAFCGGWAACRYLKACAHKWQKVAEHKLIADGYDTPHGTCYILQCKECGEIKQRVIVPNKA